MSACPDPAGTVGFFLCRAGQHLRAAAIESPRQEARILLAHALACRQE
ncbi:MAG: protein-(glutamine-N5) methyltransferase, release factor-specific, partial [Variovorax sp.]